MVRQNVISLECVLNWTSWLVIWLVISFIALVAPKRAVCFCRGRPSFTVLSSPILGQQHCLDVGQTPPCAMVTLTRSLFSSSSFLMASCMWRGMILLFWPSRAASPANSSISAEILQDGRHVDSRSAADSLGKISFAKIAMDSGYWKLNTWSFWPRFGRPFNFSSFATSRHFLSALNKRLPPYYLKTSGGISIRS